MAEERLRELERRWKDSGSPEDELAYLREVVRTGGSLEWKSYQRLAELDVDAAAAYLLARVERGDLEREKLELAAYCSHGPARVALGDEAPELPDRSGFLGHLPDPSLRSLVVSFMAMAGAGGRRDFARTISIAARWVHCPCRECALLALEELQTMGNTGSRQSYACARMSVFIPAATVRTDLTLGRPLAGHMKVVLHQDAFRLDQERRVSEIRESILAWALGGNLPTVA